MEIRKSSASRRIRSSAPKVLAGPTSMLGAKKSLVKNAVEIELTTKCNLGCYNCDRSTSQAPSEESMSLGQILFFMKESLELGRNWEYISLLGGEPTLHPRLSAILKYFSALKFNIRNLQVVSNGYGRAVRNVLKSLPNWVLVNNTDKKTRFQKFRLYNLAPADFGIKKASPCHIPQNCGYGLTRYGYYPCGAGASIDRVFGFDIGVKSLKDLTPENTERQLKVLCRYCGHSPSMDTPLGRLNEWQRKGVFKETSPARASKGSLYIAPMSRSWLKAYENYKKKRPIMRLYGAG